MEVDETGTLARVNALRRDIVEPAIAAHDGRVVKLMGDGALVEFASIVNAVTCAIHVQRAVSERSAGSAEAQRIDFRIGINLGDIIVENQDIYGDGVNVAARLQGLADPGGICVAGAVFDEARNKLDAVFEDLGPQKVKNIADPIRAYRIVVSNQQRGATMSGKDRLEWTAIAPVELSEPVPGFDGRPAVAVLPFANLSGDGENDYFADGITEDIIEGLARWRWLPVIARNSTFGYKGRSVDVVQVGSELGAKYVVDGSVRLGRTRMRITSELVDTLSRAQLWAGHYDRKLESIFDVQDEITGQIVSECVPEITIAEAHRLERRRPQKLGAWELLQRGISLHYTMGKAANAEARTMLRKAYASDPSMPFPLAWEAATYLWDLILGWSANPSRTLGRALETAEKAVRLDASEALSHAMLCTALVLAGEPHRALETGHRAVELNPSLSVGRTALGYAQIVNDQPDLALEHTGVAMRLSPRDPFSWQFWAVRCLAFSFLGDYQEALRCARQTLHQDRNQLRGLVRYASLQGHVGDVDAARTTIAELKRRFPSLTVDTIPTRFPFANERHKSIIIEGLRKAGLE